ncbi:RNA polymerase sigma factor [Spirosoma sp. KNUC1025]|nr:RNA polymerase sigma factor [Spirosoma sp. KNUC1025]
MSFSPNTVRTHENQKLGDTIADHTSFLRRVAFKYTADPEMAKDLAQDVAILAITNEDKFSGGHLKGWLSTLTYNLFVTQYHSLKKFARMIDATDSLYEANLLNHSSQNQGIFELMKSDVRAAIQQSNPVLHEVAILRMDGLKYEEIAEDAQVPLGTVRSRLKRVREILPDRSHF